MATWKAFAESAPEIAELGLKMLSEHGAAFFLATVRKDGSPRLHPVVPILAQGKLFVFCGGPKVYDLCSDGRFALHAQIDRDDMEFLIEGRAAFVNDDRTMRAAVARAAPYKVPDDPADLTHQLFHFDIERAHMTTWYHPGQPDTRPTHTDWSEHD